MRDSGTQSLVGAQPDLLQLKDALQAGLQEDPRFEQALRVEGGLEALVQGQGLRAEIGALPVLLEAPTPCSPVIVPPSRIARSIRSAYANCA